MRRTVAIVVGLAVAVAVLMAGLYATSPRATRVKVGEKAPALSLRPLMGGDPVAVPGPGARPMVLVLLDSGWPDAHRNMSDVERLYRRYLKRGLFVVGVSINLTAAPMIAEIERTGTTFLVLHDPGGKALRDTYGVPRGLEAYVIAPSGIVEGVYLDGLDLRRKDLQQRLDAHLGPPPPGW